MTERFYSKEEVIAKRESEDKYQAVTVRETPSGNFDPITFVTGVAGRADNLLLTLGFEANCPSPWAVKRGLVTRSPSGDIDVKKFSAINPAHFIVIIRDPMRTYAESRKMTLEEVYEKLPEKEKEKKSRQQVAIEKDITKIKILQNANLHAATRLSDNRGAGLSVIYSYIEDNTGLNERQAEFLGKIVKYVASSRVAK